MMVSVEVSVATMEKAKAHHGAVRPPRKYSRMPASRSADCSSFARRWRAAEVHAERGDAQEVGDHNAQIERVDVH